jgi:hypothetical protein
MTSEFMNFNSNNMEKGIDLSSAGGTCLSGRRTVSCVTYYGKFDSVVLVVSVEM